MFQLRDKVTGDAVGVPFKAVKRYKPPEGTRWVWAETFLADPSTALAATRLMKNNLLDPGDDKQMRLFHKAVKVVLELDDERDDRTSAIIASIARGEGVNQKRKAKLRGAHFGFALRIANYFVKAAWNMPEFVDSDGYLTKSKWDELRSAALADQAPAA